MLALRNYQARPLRTLSRLLWPSLWPLLRPRIALLLVAAWALALAACTAKENHAVSVTPQVVPTELFVAPDGLDNNPGTRPAPLRSLARAAQLVTPGTIVNVLPGTYQGGLYTAVDGLADARIVFRSTWRWGARIVPPQVSNSTVAWDNRGSFVDIEGFEIDGSLHTGDTGMPWTTGIYSAGSFDRIAANHVHDIATTTPCASTDSTGIGVDSYYKGSGTDVLGNSVHDVGRPGCRNVQGIFLNTPGSVRNNIVYRIAEMGIQLWHDAHDAVVANNTVAASHTGILVGGGDFYHSKGPNDRTRVYNNIVFDNQVGLAELGATGRHNSYRNNLVFENSEGDWHLARGMTHSGTVAAAPGFVAYERDGTPDFRLAAQSPAIGRGLEQDAGGPDFYGRVRARAAAVDIGACQH